MILLIAVDDINTNQQNKRYQRYQYIYITIFYLVIKKGVIKLNYFEAYKTIWNYHKKYSDMKDDETYWQAVAAESEQIAKQYNNEKFIVSLLLAVNDELQRVYLDAKKKEVS